MFVQSVVDRPLHPVMSFLTLFHWFITAGASDKIAAADNR